jgi:hypothetical protein
VDGVAVTFALFDSLPGLLHPAVGLDTDSAVVASLKLFTFSTFFGLYLLVSRLCLMKLP